MPPRPGAWSLTAAPRAREGSSGVPRRAREESKERVGERGRGRSRKGERIRVQDWMESEVRVRGADARQMRREEWGGWGWETRWLWAEQRRRGVRGER